MDPQESYETQQRPAPGKEKPLSAIQVGECSYVEKESEALVYSEENMN